MFTCICVVVQQLYKCPSVCLRTNADFNVALTELYLASLCVFGCQC